MPRLTTAGLEIDTLADVRAFLNQQWREAFGQSMDVSDLSPDGQQLGIHAEIYALFNELLEAINSSQDPDKATGAFLRALCLITGTIEIPASFSAVTLTLTGTPTTFVPPGSLASTLSTGQQFVTTADDDGTIAALGVWIGSTGYTAGDRKTNVGNAYLCITPGTSAASPGPNTEAADITDGTAHWRFLGPGAGAVDVTARATVTGPIVATSGDITNIDTPIGGWDGVINILDATPGRAAMTDAELRALRQIELAQPGTSPKNAIRAALLEVGRGTLNPVTAATVFSNVTDFTDADGVPPHSVEALVHGGEDQDIFDALLANVADGIRTHGSVVGASVDDEGTAHVMKFSRTTEILIYVSITLRKEASAYPTDGDDQVKAAIAAWGNARDDGTDIAASAVLAQCFAVTGVRGVDMPLISAAPVTVPVASTPIVVTPRQRGVFDTSRITVTSSDGEA